ncbi:cyclopropane fatty acyl phospholipid synthase [Buttiauxella gaviniae]|uniref:cyclopropane fatty acyl phospholipid synthase n=1 Tax=Buttiauxella gaviniae TaxID=82990 RepID=UPI003C725313
MSNVAIERPNLRVSRARQVVEKLLSPAGIRINGDKPWDLSVHDEQFYTRVINEGSIGLGETYVEGLWDCPALDIFFTKILRAGVSEMMPFNFREMFHICISRLRNMQSRRRAWIVGEHHYDLGNDLYAIMLDSWMQYSCGYWKRAKTLEEAQQDKLRLICEKLHLEPGMHLLDIGCGWGGLAEYASRHYGVKVDGITISVEQQSAAIARCTDLDVNIILSDYRDLDGTDKYDRVVSVGMFEHVGPKNYATWFNVVDHCLKPDGLVLLHTIGSNKSGHNVDPWIDKYIFPNGCLPSIKQIAEASERHFIVEDWHNFGADYDKTLMAWHKKFNDQWENIEGSYTPNFQRMFNYYLTACAGAFRARQTQLWQIVFSRGIISGLDIPR